MSKPDKPKETEAEREYAKMAFDSINYYRENYLPVQKQMIGDFQQGFPAMQGRQAGIANAAVEQSFARERPALDQGIAQSGASLGSGRGIGAIQGYHQDKAQSKSMNMIDAKTATRGSYLNNLASLIAQGKGQQSSAMQAMGGVADRAGRQAALDARASLAARNALGSAVGMGVGAASGYALDRYSQPPPQTQPAHLEWGASGTPKPI